MRALTVMQAVFVALMLYVCCGGDHRDPFARRNFANVFTRNERK